MAIPCLAFSSKRIIQVVLIYGLLHVAISQYRTRVTTGQLPTYRRRPVQPPRQRVPYRRPQQTTLRTEGGNVILRLEDEISKMKLSMEGMETRLRVTLSATLQQRLKTVGNDIQRNEERLQKAEDSISRLEQQLGNLGSQTVTHGTSENVRRPVELDLLAVRKSVISLEDKVRNITSDTNANQEITTQLQTLQEEHSYLKAIAASTSLVSQKVRELEQRHDEQGRVVSALGEKITGLHKSAAISEQITQLKRNISVLTEQKVAVELEEINTAAVDKIKSKIITLQETILRHTADISRINDKNDVQDARLNEHTESIQSMESLYGALEKNMSDHIHQEIRKHDVQIAEVDQRAKTNAEKLLDLGERNDYNTERIQQLNWTVAQAAAYNLEYFTAHDGIEPDFEIYPEAEVGEGDYIQPTIRPVVNSNRNSAGAGSELSPSDIEARLTDLETKTSLLDTSFAEVYKQTEENKEVIIRDKTSLDNLAERLEESMSLLVRQHSNIQNLTKFAMNSSKRMDNFTSAFSLVRAAFTRVEGRDTEHDIAIRANRRALEALTGSVRVVTQDERRQNSAIGNLRRRIRSMEGINFDTYAQLEEIESLRHNVSSKLSDLQQEVRLLGVGGGGEGGDDAASSTLIRKLTNELETTDFRVEQLAKAVAYLLNATSHPDSVLESEFKSYISVIQTIPRIQEDVNGLIKLRNVVLKNSGDVNQLHELYEATQSELVKLDSKTSNIEYEVTNLKTTDENIRSDVEETLDLYGQLSGLTNDLRNDLTLLTYSLDINITTVSGDVKTLYARFADAQTQRNALETELNGVDISLKDLKRGNEVKLAEQGLTMLQITKKMQNIDASLARISDIQNKAATKADEDITSILNSHADSKKALEDVEEELVGIKQAIEDLQRKDLHSESEIEIFRHKVNIFENELNRHKISLSTNSVDIRNNKELVTDLESLNNLQKNKIDELESGIDNLRHLVLRQANTSSVMRKVETECSAKISSIEQKVLDHEAFVRRAEEAINNHHVDIHTMLLRSSNHTAALRMLKQRVKDDNTANLTRDILYEISNFERSIQIITNDITSLQTKDDAQRLTNSEMQNDLNEMQSNLWKSESDLRQHASLIETLQLDLDSKADSQRTLSDTVRTAQNEIRSIRQDIHSHANDLTILKDANRELVYTSGILENSLRATSNKTRQLQSSINAISNQANVVNTDMRSHKLALEDMDGRLTGQLVQLQEQQNAFYIMKAEVHNSESEIQRIKDSLKSLDETKSTIISLNTRTSRMHTSIASFEERSNVNKGIITRMYSEINQTVVNFNRIVSSLAEEKRQIFHKQRETLSMIQSLRSDVTRVNESCVASLRDYSVTLKKTDQLKSRLKEIEDLSSEHIRFTEITLADMASRTAVNRTLASMPLSVINIEHSLEKLQTASEELYKTVENNSLTINHHRLLQLEMELHAQQDLRRYVEDKLGSHNNTLRKVLQALLSTPWTIDNWDENVASSGDEETIYDLKFGDSTSYHRIKNILDGLQV